MAERTPEPVPIRRRILYYSILFLVLALIMELLSRAYYYQRLSSNPSAVVQVAKDLFNGFRSRLSTDTAVEHLRRNHYRIRPGLPTSENDRINEETYEANRSEYVPWSEFAFRDFHGKYVNIDGHVRKSVPDRSDSLATAPYRIFFLGGSTLYGYSVTDEETIPSCFVREYRQKYPAGKPIQVINLGMPSFFSYQELIELTDRIFRDDKPDMVIMLDGLNDCLQANAAYQRAPIYAPGKPDMIKPGFNRMWQKEYYELPADMTVDSACTMIFRRYIENISHAREITGCYAIPLYCFWQPVPYYNYPNRQNDPICTQAPSERFGYVYPLVKSKAGQIPGLFFLGDMLQDEKGLPFIDHFHYSPAFNDAIAKKMLGVIRFP